MIRFVLGLVGTIVFGLGFAISLITVLALNHFESISVALKPLPIVLAILCVVCIIIMITGILRNRVINRLSKYSAALVDRASVIQIEDLSSILGIDAMTIRNDMRKLKQMKLSFDLYTDRTETTLIKGEAAYLDYVETERQRDVIDKENAEREARLMDPETQPLESFLAEGRAMLDKIRAANFMLPGDDISNALYKIESTAKRIFAYIENHPEKLQDTRKLMNYHLPTTLKLVEKYCQYDAMEYQPENIIMAKRDIEKALVAANEAFNNFLHGLYEVDTLDVVTEAEVLQKMFEKDGLMGSNFDIDNKNQKKN